DPRAVLPQAGRHRAGHGCEGAGRATSGRAVGRERSAPGDAAGRLPEPHRPNQELGRDARDSTDSSDRGRHPRRPDAAHRLSRGVPGSPPRHLGRPRFRQEAVELSPRRPKGQAMTVPKAPEVSPPLTVRPSNPQRRRAPIDPPADLSAYPASLTTSETKRKLVLQHHQAVESASWLVRSTEGL